MQSTPERFNGDFCNCVLILQSKDQLGAKEVEDEPEGTGTHATEAPDLESGIYSIPVPSCSDQISNVVVKSYFR